MNLKNIITIFLLPLLIGCNSIKKRNLSDISSNLWKLDSCGLIGYRDSILKNDFLNQEEFKKFFLKKSKKYTINRLGKPNSKNFSNEFDSEYYLYITLAGEEKGRECNASMIESITLMFNSKTQKIEDIYFAIY